MSIRASTFLCLATLICTLPAHAQDVLATETKLAAKLQVRAEGVRVGKLLAVIAKVTGAKLSAAKAFDETKVIVLAQSESAKELLASVAELLDAEWRDEVGDKRERELVLRPKSDSAARAAKLARQEEDKILAGFHTQTELSHWPKKRIDALAERDPRKFMLTREPTAKYGGMLFQSLTQDQRRGLLRAGRLRTTFNSLPAAFKAELPEELEKERLRQDKLPKINSEGDTIFAPGQLSSLIKSNLVDLHVSGGDGDIYLRLGYGEQVANTIVSWVFSADRWVLPAHGSPYSDKPLDNKSLPTVEVLNEAATKKGLIERLISIFDQTGATIVSDYYIAPNFKRPASYREPPKSPPTAVDMLDLVCLDPGYCWWKRGDTLLFRKRDWYVHSSFEPPYEWHRAFMTRVGQADYKPVTADLQSLSQLTHLQLFGLTYPSTSMGIPTDMLGVPSLLKAIAGSSIGQSQTLATLNKEPANASVLALPFADERGVLYANRLPLDSQQALNEFLTINPGTPYFRPGNSIRIGAYVHWRSAEQSGRGYRTHEFSIQLICGKQYQILHLAFPATIPTNAEGTIEVVKH